MKILNFIAKVIIMILFCHYDDSDLARELYDDGLSSNEIGNLLGMSAEDVDEIVGENEYNNGFYDY